MHWAAITAGALQVPNKSKDKWEAFSITMPLVLHTHKNDVISNKSLRRLPDTFEHSSDIKICTELHVSQQSALTGLFSGEKRAEKSQVSSIIKGLSGLTRPHNFSVPSIGVNLPSPAFIIQIPSIHSPYRSLSAARRWPHTSN